jgi:hypothetical protein
MHAGWINFYPCSAIYRSSQKEIKSEKVYVSLIFLYIYAIIFIQYVFKTIRIDERLNRS